MLTENLTNMKNIHKALFEAKKEMGKVAKDSTNPHFKSKYFDINTLLDTVEPILHKNGLIVLQPIKNGSIETVIVHVESGESISSIMALSDEKNPQKIGSEITYYRRYTLQSLLSLQAEDDDGNKAAEKQWFNPNTPQWAKALEKGATIEVIKQHYQISKENETKYIQEWKQLKNN